MNNKAIEYYDALWEIATNGDISFFIKYRLLRELLERLCRSLMQNESLQMTDLAARITFVAAKHGLDNGEQHRLHTLRLTANAVLNKRKEPTEDEFLRDLKTLSFTIRHLFEEDIPQALYLLLPKHTAAIPPRRQEAGHLKRIRVCYQYTEGEFFYAVPLDAVESVSTLKVRWNVEQVNSEFNTTVEQLWPCAQLNLLDVSIDEDEVYTPGLIVLEPDYMLDISSLSECFRDYGSHPGNYVLSKLSLASNAAPILIGNIANLFLDEWIHADGDADYVTCMKKAFRKYPIEIAACEDLQDKEKELKFFADCKQHFLHIGQTVKNTFGSPGYNLDKTDAVLEPSYICEALGIQGRLDYMQRDMESFVEMKSGKADEYTIRGKVEPKENHRVQMLLYMAVLEYNMNIDHRRQHPYLFYTRYSLLYPARSQWALVKRAINARNSIVANEYGVQLHNNIDYTRRLLLDITPEVLNEKKLRGYFWEQYLAPPICRFHECLTGLDSLEQKYYFALYNFITKEQYLSKSGDVSYEGRAGAAGLWLSTLADKCEAGEILYDLRMIENRAADEHKASVTLAIPVYDGEFLSNFRQGDVVVLYERNSDHDNVTNKLAVKASIESISAREVKLRIRAAQQNSSILPADSLYAIEHDSMDTGYKCMYQGLAVFAAANKARRDLLLGRRLPRFSSASIENVHQAGDDFTRVALKAMAAEDYFLLVGPPGTGKTSRALRKMVELALEQPDATVLLLAYTNRAVDEICKSLLSISPRPDFMRIGSELSCEEAYREYLLENALCDITRRVEVVDRIKQCRVMVGTVASVANKPELFKLKTFSLAIFDEATQILEPQLLGLLCAPSPDGGNAIGKFILIGDHKQLPAVVLQDREQTQIADDELRRVGVLNLSDSLFERLYRLALSGHEQIFISPVDMLTRQGRMNSEVALFPNNAFYGGRLEAIGLPHQLEELPVGDESEQDADGWHHVINRRVAFIPSESCRGGSSAKINLCEAKIVAGLAARIYQRHQHDFDPDKTLGVITPYRNQIAVIRKELSLMGVPALNDITVDTVERYQGSERDVIIYSFCVNHRWQLKQLVNVVEDEGGSVDRKLNVALTRARKQLFLTGNPELLKHESGFAELLKVLNV